MQQLADGDLYCSACVQQLAHGVMCLGRSSEARKCLLEVFAAPVASRADIKVTEMMLN